MGNVDARLARAALLQPLRPGLRRTLARPSPQPPRGDSRALRERLELRPHDARMDLGLVRRTRRKAAVGAADHALATDQARVGLDLVSDQLRVLDITDRVTD